MSKGPHERLKALREAFLRLYADGKADTAIANELRVTRNQIIGMRRRAKLPCNPSGSPKARVTGQRRARVERIKAFVRGNAPASKIVCDPPKVTVSRAEVNALLRTPALPIIEPCDFAPDWHPIMRLTPHTCRWPYGDPGSDDFAYCCAPKPPEGPYCEAHSALAKGERASHHRRTA